MQVFDFYYFFFYLYGDHRDLHSFPTRRSSDLGGRPRRVRRERVRRRPVLLTHSRSHPPRSEEHTSELQSRRDLVCRLLLEKKKQMDNRIKLLEEILSIRMQGVEFDKVDMYVDD